MRIKHVRLVSLTVLAVVLFGLLVGLGVAFSHPPSAVSAPRCSASSSSTSDASVTLRTSLPYTLATLLVDHRLIVLMPGHLSQFNISNKAVLRSVCSSVLADHNTEIVLTALAPGQSNLGATDLKGLGPAMAISVFGAKVVVIRR
jgi:hypothetical protein